jgi:hypothetical protein
VLFRSSDAELEAKFLGLAEPALGRAAHEVVALVRCLEDGDSLTRLLGALQRPAA